jgi:hypothetical protein
VPSRAGRGKRKIFRENKKKPEKMGPFQPLY